MQELIRHGEDVPKSSKNTIPVFNKFPRKQDQIAVALETLAPGSGRGMVFVNKYHLI